jgi:hypothetical protein
MLEIEIIWPGKVSKMTIIPQNQAENIVNADIFILGVQKMAHSDEMAEKWR